MPGVRYADYDDDLGPVTYHGCSPRSGWNIIKSLVLLGGWDFTVLGMLQLVVSLSMFCAPLALMYIVRFITSFQPHDKIPDHIVFCTGVLFLGPAIQAITNAQVIEAMLCYMLVDVNFSATVG